MGPQTGDTTTISGWAQVQANHFAQLFDEEWVVGELESVSAMRLQAKQLEYHATLVLEMPVSVTAFCLGGGRRCTADRSRSVVQRQISLDAFEHHRDARVVIEHPLT